MSVPARADCMVLGVVAKVVHTVCLSADGWGAKAAKQCRPPSVPAERVVSPQDAE